jgi:acetyl esterase/lipase
MKEIPETLYSSFRIRYSVFAIRRSLLGSASLHAGHPIQTTPQDRSMRFRFAAPMLTFLAVAAHVDWLTAVLPTAAAAESSKLADVRYATVDGHELKLDLYRPAKVAKPPLIVWVHGGAWRAGSKKEMPLLALVDAGYAVASVDYRLSPQAPFPAQIHDIKAAIRFLRAKQADYGYDSRRIIIAGASAGGHLASLVGVSNGNRELEGSVGGHLDQSSDVQAIVSFFGMSNLTTILSQSTPHGLKVRVPALELLLGGPPEEKPDLARLASPVFHVDEHDPPLLLIHGDQDPQAPINQSHELQGRYEAVRRPCVFHVVHGGRHGGAEFFDPTRIDLVKAFLDSHKD